MKGLSKSGNEETETEIGTKKMGLFSTTCMAIGLTIGAGVFGTIPEAINMVGTGVILVFIAGFVSTMLCFTPQLVTASVLPCPLAFYTHGTRMINPTVGFGVFIWWFMQVFMMTMYGQVFAEYAIQYIPLSEKVLSIGITVIFGIISSFGVQANAIVQNVMILFLFCAMGVYVGGGLPNLNPEFISFQSVMAPEGLTVVVFGACLTMVAGCLQGAANVASSADDIKNPGKTVPAAFVLGTFLTLVVYLFMSLVSAGVMPEAVTLYDVGAEFLSPGALAFFTFGGAVFAVLTSLNGAYVVHTMIASQPCADGVFPKWFGKINRKGARGNMIFFDTLLCVILLLCDLSVGNLLSAFGLVSAVMFILLFIPAVRVRKQYPHTYRHSWFKMNRGVMAFFVVCGGVFAVWQFVATLITLPVKVLVITVIWVGGWYLYFFVRKAYMKKKGVDIIENMKIPYPAWAENEEKWKRIDEEANA